MSDKTSFSSHSIQQLETFTSCSYQNSQTIQLDLGVTQTARVKCKQHSCCGHCFQRKFCLVKLEPSLSWQKFGENGLGQLSHHKSSSFFAAWTTKNFFHSDIVKHKWRFYVFDICLFLKSSSDQYHHSQKFYHADSNHRLVAGFRRRGGGKTMVLRHKLSDKQNDTTKHISAYFHG